MITALVSKVGDLETGRMIPPKLAPVIASLGIHHFRVWKQGWRVWYA